ncbi:MAG TPA: hypothetical protein VJ485_03660 [archaeon]|jgi:hypothetical protein|nr:hypothetical protein [archaeon]
MRDVCDPATHADQLAFYEMVSNKKPCYIERAKHWLNPLHTPYKALLKIGVERKKATNLVRKYEVAFNFLDRKLLTPLTEAECSVRNALDELRDEYLL